MVYHDCLGTNDARICAYSGACSSVCMHTCYLYMCYTYSSGPGHQSSMSLPGVGTGYLTNHIPTEKELAILFVYIMSTNWLMVADQNLGQLKFRLWIVGWKFRINLGAVNKLCCVPEVDNRISISARTCRSGRSWLLSLLLILGKVALLSLILQKLRHHPGVFGDTPFAGRPGPGFQLCNAP